MLSKRFLPYFLITLLSGLATPQLVAQSIKLDKPTRTVYKCNTDGKVVYSDTPCLGAERIDAEPTRGLDKSSGASRVPFGVGGGDKEKCAVVTRTEGALLGWCDTTNHTLNAWRMIHFWLIPLGYAQTLSISVEGSA